MIPAEPRATGVRPRLRPRDRGAILDAGFRLYRKQFLTLLAIVAVLYVPVELLVQALSLKLLGRPTGTLQTLSGLLTRTPSGAPAGAGAAGLLAYYVARILLPVLREILMYPGQGAVAIAVENEYLGRATDLAGTYKRIAGRITPLLGLMGLQLLVVVGADVLPSALGSYMTVSSRGNPATSCLVGLVQIVAPVTYLYVSVRLQLALPAGVVEGLGPVRALSRSWELVKGNWWRTFGLLTFTLGLLSLVISEGPGLLIKTALSSFVHLDATGDQAITLAVGGITTLLFLPLQYLVTTLYYFDLRVRRESFDLEAAMAQRYPAAASPRLAPARELVPAAPGRKMRAADESGRTGPSTPYTGYRGATRAARTGRIKVRPKPYGKVGSAAAPGDRAAGRPGKGRGGT
jgi:Membrane domain of glycerophosphoryl diester phosphodiesterase